MQTKGLHEQNECYSVETVADADIGTSCKSEQKVSSVDIVKYSTVVFKYFFME